MNSGNRRSAIFRCDASATIGGGHVVRSMALAQALAADGYDVGFAVSDETTSTVPELQASLGAPTTGFLADEVDDAKRLAERWPRGSDVLVVDHYGLGTDFERSVRKLGAARLIVAIDDFPTRPHDCDILVDTTHGRDAADYRDIIPASATALCGSSYAMLREPFRRARPARIPKPEEPPRALVTFGMTDSANVTGLALEALTAVAGLGAVTVVLGATAPHLTSVAQTMAARPGWRLVTAADAVQMSDLIAGSDFVLGAPGSASYERCCLAKPSLLIQLADNQAGNAASLTQAGAALLIGAWPSITADAIAAAVAAAVADPERLAAMATAAARLVDGDGVLRIRAEIEARLA